MSLELRCVHNPVTTCIDTSEMWRFIAICIPVNVYCCTFQQANEFLWKPQFFKGEEACLQQ